MFKVFAFIVIVVGAVVTVPSLRQRAMPYVQPALDPVYAWSAGNQVGHIVDLMHEEESLGRPLPTQRDFESFVNGRDFQKDASVDPWGSPYYLRTGRKSYYVGSPGKDRVADTEDDIISAEQPYRGAAPR